jgi:hypothetical protein
VTKTKTGCFDIFVEDHRVGGRFLTPAAKMSNHIFYSKCFFFW